MGKPQRQQKGQQKGGIRRSDRDYLVEYGQIPSRQVDDIEEKPFHTFDESDFDRQDSGQDARGARGGRYRQGKYQQRQEQVSEDDADVIELEEKPSAYQLLLDSLKSSSSVPKFWKRRRDEEDGLDEASQDEQDVIADDDEDELEEDNASDKDGEIVSEGEDHDGESEEVVSDEGEMEVVDDADEIEEPVQDPYHVHFGREEVSDAPVSATVVEDVDLGPMLKQHEQGFKLLATDLMSSPYIKERLKQPWKNVIGDMSPAQQKWMHVLTEYSDVLTYGPETTSSSLEMTSTLALHALNHVYKTRDRILKNNERLKKDMNADLEFRDQGFTRPKVLVLVPFKHNALQFIDTLIALLNTDQQENKKRFKQEFTLPPEEDVMDMRKPEDYRELFAGNIDDCFRVGLKFSRKVIKLYSEFYGSDIIVASPLGLKLIIQDESDYDFLSSIEMVLMERADVLYMQNWDHVVSVFEHLNLKPKDMHDTDFSRVKQWYLDGDSKKFRQTVITSQFVFPELNTLWKNQCLNKKRVRSKPVYTGSIHQVVAQVEQVFTKVSIKSVTSMPEDRFNHFTKHVKEYLEPHTCIVIPSYFDFLRVKNWFKQQELPAACLSEYTASSDITRARSKFFNGQLPTLLVTERFHFYRRYRLRGIKHLIFFAPVHQARFYSEFINMMESDEDSKVTVLFSMFDAMALERIVGTKRAQRMLTQDKNIFMFT
jgi:U3 small nucleolar RNA-associated protein 25